MYSVTTYQYSRLILLSFIYDVQQDYIYTDYSVRGVLQNYCQLYCFSNTTNALIILISSALQDDLHLPE